MAPELPGLVRQGDDSLVIRHTCQDYPRGLIGKKTEGMCRDIYKHWEAMWTFACGEGSEPTDNDAERSLRKGVLCRKEAAHDWLV